jgi:hypothetical protein
LERGNKFHFIEIDWLLFFPISGNEKRKYPKYGVAYRDRIRGVTQKGTRINLEEVLNEPDIKEKYPHTVGHYIESTGKGPTFEPSYINKRIIKDVKEFYNFLSELGV